MLTIALSVAAGAPAHADSTCQISFPTTACTDANRNGLVDGAASVTTINPAAVVAYNVDMSTYDERTGASTSRPRAPASATPHCGSNGLMSVAISTGFLRGSIYTTLTHQT